MAEWEAKIRNQYENKKIVLWGIGQKGQELYRIFTTLGYQIFAYCDNNEELWDTLRNGCPVLSPKNLKQVQEQNDNLLIQIAVGSALQQEIVEQLASLEISKCVDPFHDIRLLYHWKNLEFARSSNDKDNQMCCRPAAPTVETIQQAISDKVRSSKSPLVVICMPPKCGDYTLNHTFDYQKLQYYNVCHNLRALDREYFHGLHEPIKCIVAVRDPIAQMVSTLFQLIASFEYNFLATYAQEFCEDGGNVQKLFDKWIQDRSFGNYGSSMITKFVQGFCESIIDIMEHPFHQDKGYTIIKEGNLEVFVYTLEHMNDIIPELSEFVGVPFDQYVMGNEASNKWIAKSYKQAQEELKFSQEFFDACYNEPYVKHFYSKEDIEKFKNKWRKNIL